MKATESDLGMAGLEAFGQVEVNLGVDREGPDFDLQIELVSRHTWQVGIERDAAGILRVPARVSTPRSRVISIASGSSPGAKA